MSLSLAAATASGTRILSASAKTPLGGWSLMPRKKASWAQLYHLNGAGCLEVVAPGSSEPIDFESAWKQLELAAELGHWTPKAQRPQVTEDIPETDGRKTSK